MNWRQSVPNGYQFLHEDVLSDIPTNAYTESDNGIIIFESFRVQLPYLRYIYVYMAIVFVIAYLTIYTHNKLNIITPRIGSGLEIYQLFILIGMIFSIVMILPIVLTLTYEKISVINISGLHQYDRAFCCGRWFLHPSIPINEITSVNTSDSYMISLNLSNNRSVDLMISKNTDVIKSKINTYIQQARSPI